MVIPDSRSRPCPHLIPTSLYRDEAALETHRASDHFRAAGPGLGGVLEGRPEIELLDAVG